MKSFSFIQVFNQISHLVFLALEHEQKWNEMILKSKQFSGSEKKITNRN